MTRRAILSLCLLAASSTPILAAEGQFPYTAYISEDNVYVRSGPGKNYYPTNKLQQGAKIEVYRHDPGGWCVVRPPEGSFSWVSSRYLQVREDGLGVVTDDRVAARIGSEFSDIRDVVHIRLHEGQVVRVLGYKRFAEGTSGLWYQVAPPSGEFRWVHSKYVDPDYLTSGIHERTGVISELTHPGIAEITDEEPQSVDNESLATQSAPVSPISENTSDDAPALLPTTASIPAASRVESPQHIVEEDVALPADPMARRSLEIRRQIARMMSEEPTVWRFEEFRSAAKQLLTESETALQRGRARLLLDAIERGEELKRRYQLVAELERENVLQNGRLARLDATYEEGVIAASHEVNTYDVEGYIFRRQGAKAGEPPYVLLDAGGAPICFVSAAPGVNLEFFIRREVGVNGIRTQTAEGARHIQAKQVFPIDDPITHSSHPTK